MAKFQFLTPEWLDECAKLYTSNPDLQKNLKRLTVNMSYRVLEKPEWGINKSIIFCTFFESGELTKISLLSEEEAKEESKFLTVAPPERWVKLLRKQSKFGTDFALGKVTLEIGSKIGVLTVAPYAKHVVDVLTQPDLQFPDEMNSEELEAYRANLDKLRTELES
jgi:hypothetical protein